MIAYIPRPHTYHFPAFKVALEYKFRCDVSIQPFVKSRCSSLRLAMTVDQNETFQEVASDEDSDDDQDDREIDPENGIDFGRRRYDKRVFKRAAEEESEYDEVCCIFCELHPGRRGEDLGEQGRGIDR